MPAHYGIPCGFTRIVMDKNKFVFIHNNYTTSILYSMGWLHVSASKMTFSGHPLVNSPIKSKPHEMPAHYGIPCGFTRIVMDKNKTV
jgi:hypothetical protein